MEAWSKLDNRLAAMEDLIHKKQANLKQLEEEFAVSLDEQEKKYIGTSIKAAKLDLGDKIKGLRKDSAATKATVEGELESSASEEEERKMRRMKMRRRCPGDSRPRNLERRISPKGNLTSLGRRKGRRSPWRPGPSSTTGWPPWRT